jgi:hypothetical protein
MPNKLTIDLITEKQDGKYVLVLVEQGPWKSKDVAIRLRTVQDRIYNCIDAAIDGHIASRYPDSKGRHLVIRLVCYNTPKTDISELFCKLTKYIRNSDEYQNAINNSAFIKSIDFEMNLRQIKG